MRFEPAYEPSEGRLSFWNAQTLKVRPPRAPTTDCQSRLRNNLLRLGAGGVLKGQGNGGSMTYELIAICDGCGARVSFEVDVFSKKFVGRPLPKGWTHVHRGGQPGTVTPEIGIACSRACLSNARRTLIARRAREHGGRP